MVTVASWGRLSRDEHTLRCGVDSGRLGLLPGEQGLAFELGRSYGDACLNPGGMLWPKPRLDRFIRFDPVSGTLACGAGVTLRNRADGHFAWLDASGDTRYPGCDCRWSDCQRCTWQESSLGRLVWRSR